MVNCLKQNHFRVKLSNALKDVLHFFSKVYQTHIFLIKMSIIFSLNVFCMQVANHRFANNFLASMLASITLSIILFSWILLWLDVLCVKQSSACGRQKKPTWKYSNTSTEFLQFRFQKGNPDQIILECWRWECYHTPSDFLPTCHSKKVHVFWSRRGCRSKLIFLQGLNTYWSPNLFWIQCLGHIQLVQRYRLQPQLTE